MLVKYEYKNKIIHQSELSFIIHKIGDIIFFNGKGYKIIDALEIHNINIRYYYLCDC